MKVVGLDLLSPHCGIRQLVHCEFVKLLALAMSPAVMACSTIVAPEEDSPSEAWLVGHWIPVGAHCESDAGVVFRSDEKWLAYQSAGTWALEGQTLVTLTTHRWGSGDGIEEMLSDPERHAERIKVNGPDAYRSYRAGGDTVEMRRCSKL